jgi:hypothetical protein
MEKKRAAVKNVTNIKYKQIDKGSEINKVTNEMEDFFFCQQSIGSLDYFGMNPGKIQKFLDKQKEMEFQELLEEHKDYIFWESRKRLAKLLQNLMDEPEKSLSENQIVEELQECLKKAEVQVIEELWDKHLGGNTTD